MKIVVWGSGKYYSYYKKYIYKHNVVAIVDNDEAKQGRKIDDIIVINPNALNGYIFDKVFVCVYDYNLIKNQLLELGVSGDKVRVYCEFDQEEDDYIFWENTCNKSTTCKKIGLISHDFKNAGAPNCLLQVAKFLSKQNYHLTVASPYDGDLRERFFDLGADIYVDRRLRMGNLESIEWIQNCDLIFVNTMQLYYLLRKRNTNIPVIWWLHEPEYFYKCVEDRILSEIDKTNLYVYSVSEIADKAYMKYVGDTLPQRLLLGVKDEYDRTDIVFRKNDIVKFAVIGGVSVLKGYDILINVIEKLKDESNYKFEVICIGSYESNFGKALVGNCKVKHLPVKFMGSMEHKDVIGTLKNVDALICCSRVESMSMSVIEAFMMKKVAISSDNTGISRYILNGKNGYVFDSENQESLLNSIKNVLNNIDNMQSIRDESRKTYEQYFTEEMFEKNILDIIKNLNL